MPEPMSGANNTVALSQRECIDMALHLANGNIEAICAVFTVAYLRGNPEVAEALDRRGDARTLAIEKIQNDLNTFLGSENLITLNDSANSLASP